MRPSEREIGVEEELLLIGPDQLELVEVTTEPTTEPQAFPGELRQLRRAADDAARGRGAHVLALATSPVPHAPRSTADERYEAMHYRLSMLAEPELTCGQHIHVSIDEDEAIAILDRIRDWLPLLRALSANSPFWNGVETHYASYRTQLWDRWPTAGPTPVFGTRARYDDEIAALIESGAALDAGMVYFDARLSEHYPAIEIRVPDVCARVEDAAVIAALCRGLVSAAARDHWSSQRPIGSSTNLLRAATWRASRYGLDSDLVDPRRARLTPADAALSSLIDYCADSLHQAGDLDYVHQGLDRIRTQGNGAALFRRAVDSEGLGGGLATALQSTLR